jgi:hypothetical protein
MATAPSVNNYALLTGTVEVAPVGTSTGDGWATARTSNGRQRSTNWNTRASWVVPARPT